MTSTLETIDVSCVPPVLILKNDREILNPDGHEPRDVATFTRDLEAPGSGGTFVPDYSPGTVQTQLLAGPKGETPVEEVPGWEEDPSNHLLRIRTRITCDVCPYTFVAVDFTQSSTDPGLVALLQYVTQNHRLRIADRRSAVTLQQLNAAMDPRQVGGWFHPSGPGRVAHH
ncbi:hypothetical protein ABLG96_13755 [Nakamurella sp. A5-74]|uniref:Uncharacterized protein n=1 Tax=Nakamurella sp. A5-74 TaxID=3158264 RepID=A0AAU8DM83_9ACTN